MVKGLKILHDLNILHRDLKSANILLFNDGTAKIGDCNVSKIFYGERGMGYTQTGTPYYASPEVWSEAPYDQKSDIWSLGIITYEMLTLHPPFKAANMEALYKKIIKGQYNKISSRYSRDIGDVVRQLLMVDPKDRPTCDEILKCDMVMERIDFFKDREGFVEEENNPSEENKLMKSFRLTKNMRFISEQLPNPNYESPKNSNSNTSNTNNNKNPKLNKNINSNSSLPNINKSHHHHERNATKNDLKIDSPKKSFTKYKLINIINTSKREFSNDNNSIDKTQKNISMETEQPILSYTKNNYKRLTNIKEIEKTNHNDSINLSRKFLYNAHLKTKSVSKNDNKNSKSKYKKELSLISIYPEYERDNKRNNNNERYNIYLNRNNINFLPNIYGNKIINSTRRSKVKNKK
jgi:NIMA (never in mitosis gene a)-related kinase